MLTTYLVAIFNWLATHLLSVFGTIISGASAWIAWQQTRIASTQLRREQYDRKRQVYGWAKAFLVSFQQDGRVTGEAYQGFVEGTADAEFLFGSDVLEYLEMLRHKAIRDMYLIDQLKDSSISEEERSRLIDEKAKIELWFSEQFAPMRGLFRKAMRL